MPANSESPPNSKYSISSAAHAKKKPPCNGMGTTSISNLWHQCWLLVPGHLQLWVPSHLQLWVQKCWFQVQCVSSRSSRRRRSQCTSSLLVEEDKRVKHLVWDPNQTVVTDWATHKALIDSKRRDQVHHTTAWIVYNDQSLSVVENSSFQAMIKSVSKLGKNALSNSSNCWIKQQVLLFKAQMKKYLQHRFADNEAVATVFHWTSKGNNNYGAVTVHCIDDFKLHQATAEVSIGDQRGKGSSQAAVLFQEFHETLSAWGLEIGKDTDTEATMGAFQCS